MVKKLITNLDSSKASGPDCTAVMVLKTCESYILAELFNMSLKEYCFPHCWKVSSVVPVFKNVGERFAAKNYTMLDFFLWLVKSLRNLYIALLVTLRKCGLFSDVQYGFSSSQSTADLLTVAFGNCYGF